MPSQIVSLRTVCPKAAASEPNETRLTDPIRFIPLLRKISPTELNNTIRTTRTWVFLRRAFIVGMSFQPSRGLPGRIRHRSRAPGQRASSPDPCRRTSSAQRAGEETRPLRGDRKSTRLNSSHSQISYAVFCLKKKKKKTEQHS